jgi:hypothetical protein
LQNPFYEQVILPLVYNHANATGVFLPITPDTRQKPEKWTRIEGTLEPLNRLGHLIFNEKEKDEPKSLRIFSGLWQNMLRQLWNGSAGRSIR